MTVRLDAQRACRECGAPFVPGNTHGEFCSTACRKAFANRRMTRGAELYDLLMVLRYERPLARAKSVFTLLCRAAQRFREARLRERAGRPSWEHPDKIVSRRPYLRAERVKAMRRAA